MKVKNFFVALLLLLFLLAGVLPASAQQVTVNGYNSKPWLVYDDSLAGAVTKVIKPESGHSGWFRWQDMHFASGWMTFDTTGFAAGIGLTSADTVKLWMEQYTGDTTPTSATTGFYEATAPGTAPTRELLATLDSTLIVDNPKLFFSFHGTGDPEIALSHYVRFYTQVIGGFTNAGLGFKFEWLTQP